MPFARNNLFNTIFLAGLASLTADDLRNIAERILDPSQSPFNDCAIVPKGTQLTGFDRLTLNA